MTPISSQFVWVQDDTGALRQRPRPPEGASRTETLPCFVSEWAALESLREQFGYKTRMDVVRRLVMLSRDPAVRAAEPNFHLPRAPQSGRKLRAA